MSATFPGSLADYVPSCWDPHPEIGASQLELIAHPSLHLHRLWDLSSGKWRQSPLGCLVPIWTVLVLGWFRGSCALECGYQWILSTWSKQYHTNEGHLGSDGLVQMHSGQEPRGEKDGKQDLWTHNFTWCTFRSEEHYSLHFPGCSIIITTTTTVVVAAAAATTKTTKTTTTTEGKQPLCDNILTAIHWS